MGQGDDHPVVPVSAAALPSAELMNGARLRAYKGGDQGLCATPKDRVNADLLAFVQS